MEELTHSLLENGSIQMKRRAVRPRLHDLDLQVPDTIQGIIAARMDRLEENLKRIMQVASVIGREFAFRILQAISGMRKEVKADLLDLQRLELIYEKSLFPELAYIFKHALIQEVAYNSLLLKRRKDIHERIAHAIEELYPDRLEEFYEMLAYHYARGEDLRRPATTSRCRETKRPGVIPSGRPPASTKRPSPPSAGCPRPRSARTESSTCSSWQLPLCTSLVTPKAPSTAPGGGSPL